MSILDLDAETNDASEQNLRQLSACPDCRQLVSLRAASCPHCGSPFHSTTRQQPTLGRIVGGIILGYLGIMLINVVFFLIITIFFAGLIGGALNRTTPSRTPTTTFP
jgi:uncharacterized paraquat-inducible protein A